MSKVFLTFYRSVSDLDFEVGPFTVLFGKNNAGKTNLLEAIYGVLAPQDLPGGAAPLRDLRGHGDPDVVPAGAVYVDLERGLSFDDAVMAMLPAQNGGQNVSELPSGQVCFVNIDKESELWFGDFAEFYKQAGPFETIAVPIDEDAASMLDGRSRAFGGPQPRPLYLGWQFDDVDERVTAAMAELTAVPDRWGTDDDEPLYVMAERGFLEPVDEHDPVAVWRVRPQVRYRLDQLATLATNLLPDFVDGSIHADLHVPTQWGDRPVVRLWFEERGGGQHASYFGHSLGDFGRGVSRWLSIAVQIALRLMEDDPEMTSWSVTKDKAFSGHVLFVDEPEAHLHPSAVASVVRWCQRIVDCGINVVAASHHEEFLRASGEGVTFVKVSRDVESSLTNARTVITAATPVLQELAAEIGLHPAAALSLHRAILFVEGPLDEAVLDEFAGPELDAAGVTIIPIHGTKNLEGLIDGEFTTRLGIKAAVLLDNTTTSTMWDRSNKKRSGEEKKLIKLIQRFQDQGLPPPHIFGVPEDDLLFALPAEGIRKHFPMLAGKFPGWLELREECRVATGASMQASVDWKAFAENHYRLPIRSSEGVRSVVRALDLANVPMPSIRAVVDEILAWSATPPISSE